jgi:putative mRNA 3-end processing factor
VRIEAHGQVWGVSGDYRTEPDRSCPPFEPVRCDTFITESTFGLPIFRWQPQAEVIAEIVQWWRTNAASGRASVLFCYAFGKAQRVLAALAGEHAGPVLCHGALLAANRAYAEAGIDLGAPSTVNDTLAAGARLPAQALAPPSAQGTP